MAEIALSPIIAAASRASGEAQAKLLTATGLELALLCGAAGGGMLGSLGFALAPYVSILSFAGALLVRGFVYRENPDRGWYDGRAAAESAKTLAWRYAVGGRPFGVHAGDQREVDEEYIQNLNDVISSLTYVDSDPTAGAQITPEMRDMRSRSLEQRRHAYEEGRIVDQQTWYADRARFNADRANLWGRLLLGSELLGVALGILGLGYAFSIDVFGFVAACSAAFGAWLQVKQHGSLARAYSVASQELAAVRSLISHQHDEKGWEDFVDQAEEAISREHTLWRASRGVADPLAIPRTFERERSPRVVEGDE